MLGPHGGNSEGGASNRLAHQVVADRYELLESVGRGGFGVVWRACDTLLQRHVAVKEITSRRSSTTRSGPGCGRRC